MIARYSRSEMKSIFEGQRRYERWLEVQLAVGGALARKGWIPRRDWIRVQKKGNEILKRHLLKPSRIEAIEKTTKHDVIAATTASAELMGPEGRWLHFGLTSSDVVDTALSLQLVEALELIEKDLIALIAVLKKRAREFQKLPAIGRTHGMFAEPTSFGLKFLSWFAEMTRNHERVRTARETIRYGKLSGAVGASPHWGPAFEAAVLKGLGLKREPVSTQVIPRDRHAEVVATLGIVGSSMERIAVELRHLQRSEVAEVTEPFSKGQKGSSAMPHKRNPIGLENLTGCARLLRGFVSPALENIALWHERDISHSAVERVMLPDVFILLDYALDRLTGIVRGLKVHRDHVKKNLDAAGETVMSGHVLLALVKSGLSREEAYAMVQQAAHEALDGSVASFTEALSKNPEIRKRFTPSSLKKLVRPIEALQNTKAVFSASFKT